MINCGGLSYASYRLVDLVEECVDYSPDLIIVMSGHNEFIEARHYAGLIGADSVQSRLWYNLRTVRLLYHFSNKRPQPVLGDNPFITEHYIVRDQAEFDQTFDHYSRNLNRMVDACKDHRVPVILCTCPSNLLDHPPFYTVPPESMNEAEFFYQAGTAIKLIESGQHEEALTMAQGVLRDDPRSAIFHYIAGKCYFEMQRFKEAKASLILAKETDAFPKRALDSFNGFVRDLARESNLELFDAEAVFFAESEHGIPGENLFIDDCHPTVKGHRLFAEGLKEIAATILREESKRNSE
jgi:lysophospholipase L1-like esterase